MPAALEVLEAYRSELQRMEAKLDELMADYLQARSVDPRTYKSAAPARRRHYIRIGHVESE